MHPKILVVYPIPKEGLSVLKNKAELIYPDSGRAFSKEEIIEHIEDCEGLLSVFNSEVDADIIKAAPKLKIIANYGVGYNNINTDLAKRRNIVVCNTPDPVTEPTAELTIFMIISLLRKTYQFEKLLREGPNHGWDMMFNLGNTLRGKTLGIIGLGKVGKSVADKAKAFGLEINYYQRRRLSSLEENSWGARYRRLHDLLKNSDIVSLHVPLTPETHHLISSTELNMMQKHAVLINTSRGAVVEEKALLTALQEKHIAAAALDVFEKEPTITEGLLDQENLIAFPHIGTQTLETRIEMGKQAAQNLCDFFADRVPLNRVI